MSRSELSRISSVANTTLAEWEKVLEDNHEERRGLALSVTEEFIGFICEAADEYQQMRKRKKRIKIKFFLKWLNRYKKKEVAYFNCGKSRRLITDILVANGRYKEKVSEKYPVYRPRIKRFYPNAQVVLDGKEKDIELWGEKFSFNLETLQDMSSEAITACKLSDEEDGRVVRAVIEEHLEKYGSPLSILYDNSSANLSSEVSEVLKEYHIIPINAFKGRPQTKAILEGEFGLFERTVGELKIDGLKKKDLAKDILSIVVDIYIKMRNMMGRCSICNRRPLDLMNYAPTEQEMDNAKRDLKEIKKRSDRLREKGGNPLPEKEQLIEDIIKRNQLFIDDIDRFKKVMLAYDREALEKAELDFYAYSHREIFDETKRTGQYFGGIVRNKQMDIDNKKKEELKRRRYFVDQMWRQRREDYERSKEEREEKNRIKRDPEIEMAKWIENAQNTMTSLGMVPKLFYDKIRQCLSILVKKTDLRKRIKELKSIIMSFTNFTLDQRLMLVKLIEKWIGDCKTYGVKSVTLKL